MLPGMDKAKKRKIAATIGLLLLALMTWIGKTEQVLGLAGYDSVQDQAHGYLMDVRGRALEVFLAARTADGLIALMESVQVGPVVAEARPATVLEPVREVMDHLGNMMSVSAITVEAIDILRRVGLRISFSAIIPLALVILALSPWIVFGRFSLRPIGQGILVLGLVLTVGIPAAVCAEKYISRYVIENAYAPAYQDVSHIRNDLDTRLAATPDQPPADPVQPVEPPSTLSRIETWLSNAFSHGSSALRAVTEPGGMESITGWLNAKVESALTLMALFLVEVFAMPSLFGYALYSALRSMIAAAFAPRI
jgi:hypothetical protein